MTTLKTWWMILGQSFASGLTEEQLFPVLQWIDSYRRTHDGISPTLREMGQHFLNPASGRPASLNTVHIWLGKLQVIGWVKVYPDISRGIGITPKGREALEAFKKKEVTK